MNEVFKNSIRWILLILIQVGLLNNIGLWGLINPFIYIFFVLMLPIATPRSLLMLLAFGTGLVIDVASNTGGLHAMSATLIAFLRPWWIKMIFEKSKYIDIKNFKIEETDTTSFILYSSLLIFIHHSLLYFVEAADISLFLYSFGKSIANSSLALLTFIGFRFFSFRTERTI